MYSKVQNHRYLSRFWVSKPASLATLGNLLCCSSVAPLLLAQISNIPIAWFYQLVANR